MQDALESIHEKRLCGGDLPPCMAQASPRILLFIHHRVVGFFTHPFGIKTGAVIIKRALTFVIGEFIDPVFLHGVNLGAPGTQRVG
jgi:hypothetical protein